MMGRTGLWLSSLILCAAVAANELLDADSALMRGDYGAAVKILQERADSGDAAAMVRLANLYHRGEGVARDTDKAVSLYLSAAETGNSEAQFNLGNMYLLGEGLPQNEDWALTFYRLAAKQGHKMAERNMRELARANGIEIAGTDTPVKPPVSDDIDHIDTPAPQLRQVDPIASATEPTALPVAPATAAAETSRIDVSDITDAVSESTAPRQGKPAVASVVAIAPVEEVAALEVTRNENTETEAAPGGEISVSVAVAEQVVAAPPAADLAAFEVTHSEQTEGDLAPSTANTRVVDRAATDTEIAAAAAAVTDAQNIMIEADDELDLGVVIEKEPAPSVELAVTAAETIADSSVIAVTDAPADSDRGSVATPLLVLDPIDNAIEETVSEIPADEAHALRLAQEHGIAVQLDTAQSPPADTVAAPAMNLPEDTVGAEGLPLSDRFERAQRAVALQNYAHGRELLQELSSDGYAPAALLLANMAERGEGMGADAVLAMRWRERAAALGSPEAQYQLAERHLNGHGFDPDEAMAITFYRDAARGGHELAQEKLRVIFAEAGLPMPDFTDQTKPTVSRTPAAVEDIPTVEDTVSTVPDVVTEPINAPAEPAAVDFVSDTTSASDDVPLPVLSEPLIVEGSAPLVSLKGSAAELLQPTTRISKPDFAVEGPAEDMVLKIADESVEIGSQEPDPPAASTPSPAIVETQIQRDADPIS